MIPIAPQPEPADFDAKVRIPGKAFLKANARPIVWQQHWKKSLKDLYKAYKGVCAYCAHWIPRCEGIASVDHFLPKSLYPDQTYEWRNFRLASLRMNARKGDYQDVLDPFTIANETFILDFATLRPSPGPRLPATMAQRADATIRRLKLDDDVCVESRIDWLRLYAERELTLSGLKKRAPFLAHEIQRQGLSTQAVRRIFRRPNTPSA